MKILSVTQLKALALANIYNAKVYHYLTSLANVKDAKESGLLIWAKKYQKHKTQFAAGEA